MRNYDARRLSTAVKMLFNIEMLLKTVSYGCSNFYNIDYRTLVVEHMPGNREVKGSNPARCKLQRKEA